MTSFSGDSYKHVHQVANVHHSWCKKIIVRFPVGMSVANARFLIYAGVAQEVNIPP